MKETFYFSHDYHARTDEKIIELLSKEWWEGYWLFWAIVEKLYENEWYIDKEYERIAYDLRTQCERIQRIVEDYGLFQSAWKKITSKSIEHRLRLRKGKSEQARQSANKRWQWAKQDNANALRTQSDGNAIKERKGKENKVKEIDTTATDLLLFFNSTTWVNLKLTDKKKEQLKNRLKTFSIEEIQTAIKNRMSSHWHVENWWTQDWDSLFCNDEKIDKMLNVKWEQPIQKVKVTTVYE